jgi:hypothetical protein
MCDIYERKYWNIEIIFALVEALNRNLLIYIRKWTRSFVVVGFVS